MGKYPHFLRLSSLCLSGLANTSAVEAGDYSSSFKHDDSSFLSLIVGLQILTDTSLTAIQDQDGSLKHVEVPTSSAVARNMLKLPSVRPVIWTTDNLGKSILEDAAIEHHLNTVVLQTHSRKVLNKA